MVLSGAVVLPIPFVFGDEFDYAYQTRHGFHVSENSPHMQGLLYFGLMQHFVGTRTDMLAGARLFNAAAIAFAVLPMLATARRFLPLGLAALLTAIVCLGPTSSCTVYFMPEAFYFDVAIRQHAAVAAAPGGSGG